MKNLKEYILSDNIDIDYAEFARYCEDIERAEEYWARQEQIEKENRLLDLEEKYGIRFDI